MIVREQGQIYTCQEHWHNCDVLLTWGVPLQECAMITCLARLVEQCSCRHLKLPMQPLRMHSALRPSTAEQAPRSTTACLAPPSSLRRSGAAHTGIGMGSPPSSAGGSSAAGAAGLSTLRSGSACPAQPKVRTQRHTPAAKTGHTQTTGRVRTGSRAPVHSKQAGSKDWAESLQLYSASQSAPWPAKLRGSESFAGADTRRTGLQFRAGHPISW